ncbi:MAG: acyl carrier protein [Paludibacteraceae bacterium]|nr:acyl carrier protein [Paludibacteraceae bacterium]
MEKQQIIQLTNAFFSDTLGFDMSQVTPDTELKRDLGVTSVDAVAIASFARKTFGCPIIMSEIKAIITMCDLYDYIEQHI